MASPPYYPADSVHPLQYHHTEQSTHSVLDSSRSLLEQACTPSLKDILGAYKYSKGQDGDCQLLIAVLNAKSAEDQRLAAVAKLHTTMLEFEGGRHTPPPSFSSSSSRSPPQRSTTLASPSPHLYPRYAQSSYVRSESDVYDRKGKRGFHSWHHSRTPYERPMIHPQAYSYSRRSRASHAQDLPPSPYSSRASNSPTSSPRAREAMAIDSLLSPDRDRCEDAS